MLVAANPRQQRNIYVHLFSQRTPQKKHNNRTEELPPVGFEVLALVLKLEGGSGGPARSTFRKLGNLGQNVMPATEEQRWPGYYTS